MYMKTTIINGSVFINDEEVCFNELTITEHEEDIGFNDDECDFADDCDINNYIESCDDCGFCACEDEVDDTEEFIDGLIEDYTNIIWEIGSTPEEISNILISMLGEVIEDIFE